ncbi:MAG: hypothetical protein Kow0060_06250 [Methylohalobius crimeensis]
MALAKAASILRAYAGDLVHWRGVFWQTLHLAGGGGLYLVLWLVLARFWPVETFGHFNFLFAFISVSGIFFDFGLDVLLTRLVAGSGRAEIPAALLVVKASAVAVFFPLFAVIGKWAGIPWQELGLFLPGVLLLSLTALLNSVLRGMDRLDLEGRIGLGQKLVFAGGTILGVVLWQRQIVWVGQCYLVSHLLALALTVWRLRRLRWGTAVPMAAFKPLLREAWPLWGVALLSLLARRADVFFLETLMNERAVGIFSAASRLIEGITVVGSAYMAAVFPRLVNGLGQGGFGSILRRSALFLGLAGLAIGVLGFVGAEPLVALLYGDAYQETVPVLEGMMLLMAVIFLADLLGQGMMAKAWQGRYMLALGLGLAATAAVAWYAIPRFGTMGAVYGYWVREVLLAAVLTAVLAVHASR